MAKQYGTTFRGLLRRIQAQRFWESQKVRFLFVGMVNTVFGYLLFVGLLFASGGKSYVLTGIISHCLATTLSFALNRFLVFGSGGPVVGEFMKFQATYTVVLALNLALLIAFVEFLRWPVLVAQAVCLCFVAVSSYLGHKYFSFRRAGRSESSQ